MMKRMMIALVAMAVTALPSFAAEGSAPGMKANPKQMMQRHHEMKGEMASHPKHLLAMAYHKNLVTFGRVLEKVAQQGETVPGDFARATIAEMRRSADQMEKYHADFLKSSSSAPHLSAGLGANGDDKAKMMADHLAQVKIHLGSLEELARGDRIDSKEVLKHLEPLLNGCERMSGEGAHCEEGACRGAYKGEHGMQQRHKMMEEMKVQDAELSRLIGKMNRAPKDQKQGVMADILTRMVKERAAMNAHLEHHLDNPMLSGPMIEQSDDTETEDADSYDTDSNDTDSDADDLNMNMDDMNMQDEN